MLLSYLIKKKSYVQPDYYLTLKNSSCELFHGHDLPSNNPLSPVIPV